VPGANSYQVERAIALEGTYTVLATVTGNSFSDSGAVSEQTYFYRVVSNFDNGSSAASKVISAKRSDLKSDISVTSTKSASESHRLGSTIEFPIKVENKGPNSVSTATLFYNIPQGMAHVSGVFSGGSCDQLDRSYICGLGALSTNDSKVITVKVTAISPNDEILVFRGTGSFDDPPDINASNDSIILSTKITASYDLAVSAYIDQSDSRKAYIEIINNGPSDAENISLELNYSKDSDVVILPDRGACDLEVKPFSCLLGTIKTGETSKVLFAQPLSEDASLKLSLNAPLDSSPRNNSRTLYFGDLANSDIDNDGISDAQEALDGTDPLIRDTDGDGLTDGQEASNGTNPLSSDTDNDGYSDREEVDFGSNALSKDSFPRSGLNILLIKAALELKNAKEESCVEPDCANNE
jgi:uncharacterized repeat protein (TIGR01451 family)